MNITIDGKICIAEHGEFILDIARRHNIHIPTLCHSEALPGQANCRLCIVEVIENDWHKVVTSCVYPVTKEIEVLTQSDKIVSMRRTIIRLLISRAPNNETLNKLKVEYAVPETARFISDPNEQCILCGLCVKACEELGSAAISTVNRGITKKVSTPYDEPAQTCIGCKACALICPTGAIKVCDEGNERVIWNKKFELLSCATCGEIFTTKKQFDYINHCLGTDGEELLCGACKRSAGLEKLKAIYGMDF